MVVSRMDRSHSSNMVVSKTTVAAKDMFGETRFKVKESGLSLALVMEMTVARTPHTFVCRRLVLVSHKLMAEPPKGCWPRPMHDVGGINHDSGTDSRRLA